MIRDSVAEPQEMADRLLAQRPRTRIVLEGALLVSVLDALLLGILGGGMASMPTPGGELALSPCAAGALSLAVLSAGLQVGGQMLGGKGRRRGGCKPGLARGRAIAIQVATLLAALICRRCRGRGLLASRSSSGAFHFARALTSLRARPHGRARCSGAWCRGDRRVPPPRCLASEVPPMYDVHRSPRRLPDPVARGPRQAAVYLDNGASARSRRR
jgi:hypothetical protein